MGTQLPLHKKGAAPNFRTMSIVAKQLYGSRWHLRCRWASAQDILCWIGTQLPSPKRRHSHPFPPISSPCLLWPNGWMDQDATCYGVGLSPSDIALDGDPAPLPKNGVDPNRPQILAHVCCAERLHGSRLHMEEGLGPGHVVPDRDLSPFPVKGAEPPTNFRPMSTVAKRLHGSRCHLVSWR